MNREEQATLIVQLRDEAAFEAMGKKWNSLLETSGANTFFLTWEWMWTWWQVYGSSYQLCLLEVSDEKGTCLGLAPLKISRRHYHCFPYRQVEFIGYGPEGLCPDYLDLIIAPGVQEQVIRAVWSYFIDHKESFDIVRLTDTPNSNQTLSFLNALTREIGYVAELEEGSRCLYLPIQGTWEDYSKSLTQKHRYNLRRREQDLQKLHGLTFEVIQTRPALDEAIEELFKLHQGVWNARGEGGSFDCHPSNRSFHRLLVDRIISFGGVVIYALRIDGALGAMLYAYRYDNRVFHYQNGRDEKWLKYGIGQLLVRSTLQFLFKEGVREFDFLRGQYPYKYDWTKLEHLNMNLAVWNQNAYGQLLHSLMRIERFLRRTGRPIKRMIRKAFLKEEKASSPLQ